MYRFSHAAMATEFEIHCTHADEAYARQAARSAFDAVDRLEQQLSRFVENSDISRINSLSEGECTRVGYETMQCLQLAHLVHAETGEAFDVSIGTGFSNLDLVPAEFLVRLQPPSPGRSRRAAAAGVVRIDLGAIGKGFAVDRMADVLEEWEVHEALIDGGCSSVLALEPPSGCQEWPLSLSRPGGGTAPVLARIGARQRVLGASGIRKGDHILNPRTGKPVRSRQAAWMSAPRQTLAEMSCLAGGQASPAALADALSTAFMIMPIKEIDKYCRRHPGLEAWILLVDGRLTHINPERRRWKTRTTTTSQPSRADRSWRVSRPSAES